MKTHKFARKPFYVDAVRVSEANIEEVAQWCDGAVETEENQRYVKVKVLRPLNDRQTQAFIGDWVLFAGTGFKVYTTKAFDKAFEKVKTLTKAQADAAGIKVPHEPSQKPKRVGHVGQALQEAQAKKVPVPAPPKQRPAENFDWKAGVSPELAEAVANNEVKIVESATLESVSVVSDEPKDFEKPDADGDVEVAPGITLHGVDNMAEESELGANTVQAVASAMPVPQFSEIVVDREIPKIYTEEEKDANAQAAIEAVLKEG